VIPIYDYPLRVIIGLSGEDTPHSRQEKPPAQRGFILFHQLMPSSPPRTLFPSVSKLRLGWYDVIEDALPA
jgi:hypothetical protein